MASPMEVEVERMGSSLVKGEEAADHFDLFM